jgi:peptidoglycan/xylan/chitin deacetylase (PgdA/CDA1 family)
MSPGHTSQIPAPPMSRAERRTLIAAAVLAMAAVLVLGVIAAAWAAMPHAVNLTADGTAVQVPSGSSVGDVVRMGYVKAARGDILSVAGGVARAGGGGDPTIVRNGRLTSLEQPVYDGDALMSTRGNDVVERTVTATEAIPAKTRYLGNGPIMSIARPGVPGVRRVVKGAVSGSVVASDVLVAPRTSVVLRRTPRPTGKVVALTFDDGPWPGSTLKIVDILKRENVRATFFMVGVTASKRPAVARRVAAAGMLVGSHSFSHKPLKSLPRKSVRREVLLGSRRIAQVTHTEQRWFRSPYGLTDVDVLREVRADKLRIAGWTVDSRDWTRPGTRKIVKNVVYATRPGSIVLMHDGGGNRNQTVAALPFIIKQLKKKGYTFVTLDELAAMSR